MGREIELLVNPAAGRGRAGRMIGDVSRELVRAGFSVQVHRTSGRAELAEMARRLVERGAPLVGVMGGDGTLHDAVNGLLRDDGTLCATGATCFAVIPAGTGGDLAARTLGIPSGVGAVADWLAAAKPRPFDLGHLTFTRPDGTEGRHLFVNIASCGMSGRADRIVAGVPRWMSGKAAYLYAGLRALVGWRNQKMRVKVDGKVIYDAPAVTVAVANGRAFGGGMIVAPDARPDDGLFEVIVLGDLSTVESMLLSRPLYAGTHLGERGIVATRGALVEIDGTDSEVLLDVDGETPGRLPASFRVMPGAISLLGTP